MTDTQYDRIPAELVDSFLKTFSQTECSGVVLKVGRMGTKSSLRIANPPDHDKWRTSIVYDAELKLAHLVCGKRSDREGRRKIYFRFKNYKGTAVEGTYSEFVAAFGKEEVDQAFIAAFEAPFPEIYTACVDGPEVTPDGVVVPYEPAQNLPLWGSW